MNSRPATLSAPDLKAISDVVASAPSAQSDAATLLRLHTLATVIVNIAGRLVLGRDAFGDAMTAAPAPVRDVRTEVTIDDVRAAKRDTVVVSCTKVVRDGRTTADAHDVLPAVGLLTYVMVLSEDG